MDGRRKSADDSNKGINIVSPKNDKPKFQNQAKTFSPHESSSFRTGMFMSVSPKRLKPTTQVSQSVSSDTDENQKLEKSKEKSKSSDSYEVEQDLRASSSKSSAEEVAVSLESESEEAFFPTFRQGK